MPNLGRIMADGAMAAEEEQEGTASIGWMMWLQEGQLGVARCR